MSRPEILNGEDGSFQKNLRNSGRSKNKISPDNNSSFEKDGQKDRNGQKDRVLKGNKGESNVIKIYYFKFGLKNKILKQKTKKK